MRSALWSLILCIGVGVASLAATRSVEADRPGVDERPPAAVCVSDEAITAAASGVAMCGKCGDNFCNPRCGENATSCPKDCGGVTATATEAACGKCGDGYCNPRCGESSASCPKDCGISSPS